MNKYARILTEDARFLRLLTLEFLSVGIETVSVTRPDEASSTILIVDLDRYSEKDFQDGVEYAAVLGFTSKEKTCKSCTRVFHRPFLMSELISAVSPDGVRPYYDRKVSAASKKPKELELSPTGKYATYGDVTVDLSDNEYKLLTLLYEKRGELVTRDEIARLFSSEEGNIGDVYICHLRKKIDNRLALKLIYTVRNKGYMLKI